MLYVIVITICWIVIAGVNALCFQMNFFAVLLFALLAIIAVVIVDAIVAIACRALPKKCVPYGAKIYQVSGKEKRFYEKLFIRKWKDKVPEIGHFTGFRKTKVQDPKSVEYVERFLLECRYGEVVHFVSCLVGFVILFPLPNAPIYHFPVTIAVAAINALLNVLPLFVLRYNFYKLDCLYQANLKKLRAQNAKEGAERDEN